MYAYLNLEKSEKKEQNTRKIVTGLMSCVDIGVSCYGDEFNAYISQIRNAYEEQCFFTVVTILDEALWRKYRLSIDTTDNLKAQAKRLLSLDVFESKLQKFEKIAFEILAEKNAEIKKIDAIHLDLKNRWLSSTKHRKFTFSSSEAQQISQLVSENDSKGIRGKLSKLDVSKITDIEKRNLLLLVLEKEAALDYEILIHCNVLPQSHDHQAEVISTLFNVCLDSNDKNFYSRWYCCIFISSQSCLY
ncbi:MAG: hypothetical protein HAW62_04420 [Endozoicomonadaceae bacterium]|nr:hypothetical protein [Endozoicomonadaceae bacterium]